MSRAKKELVVNEIRKKLLDCEGAVLVDYRGLTVRDINELRSKCHQAGVEYRVVKNSLTRLAVKDTGLKELYPYLVGPTAIGIGLQDPVSLTKIMVEFAKDHEGFKIKAGILKGGVIGPEKVKELANLPPREILVSQLLASMEYPIISLTNILAAPLRELINLLKAIQGVEGEIQDS